LCFVILVNFRCAFAQQAADDWLNKSIALGLLEKYDETVKALDEAAS
jgi:hypothetical protein